MLENPFAILRPYQQQLRIGIFTKEDPPMSDEQLAKNIGATDAAALWQMHGPRVIRVDGPTARTEQADGMITATPGLALLIRAADCQNFVIYAPKKNVLGVLHIGWRCIETGTIGSFYKLLKDEWNIDPRETFVGGGPSLCKQCAEFSDPVRELPHVPQECIDGNRVDLMRAARLQMTELGVPEEGIEQSTECTRCHPEKYWTYRGGDREAVKQGRTNVLACVLCEQQG